MAIDKISGKPWTRKHDNPDVLAVSATPTTMFPKLLEEFETLCGAGGQTVFAALTTGTHGGDFRFPPIADSVTGQKWAPRALTKRILLSLPSKRAHGIEAAVTRGFGIWD